MGELRKHLESYKAIAKANQALPTPDPDQAAKYQQHIDDLEAKLQAAKSPNKRKHELAREISDSEEISRLRNISFGKQKEILNVAQAKADEDEATIYEQEEECVVNRRRMEEIKAAEGAEAIAKGKPVLNPSLKSFFELLPAEQ